MILALAFGRIAAAQESLQTLNHHVRPAVVSGKAEVVGALPPDQQLNFSIVLPLRNQKDLADLLQRLYDPTSADFRHFLSVSQFTSAFGPSADDYQAVVSFARANGFTVTGAPANRVVVPVRASVDQINKAFHLTMTQYKHPVEERDFYSPDREPSLDLAVPVAHISGLDNYSIPKPMLKRSDRDLKQGVQAANILGSGPQQSYLASDMRAAYYGGTTLDGNGQSVGLVEFGGYSLSDVEETFSTAGQSYEVPVENVLLDGASAEPEENADDAEQVLDIVQAVGMAPGLDQVRVYIGAGNDDANVLNSMASENMAKSLSSSWSWIPADPSTDDVFFKEFAAQGQSFFEASGDNGAYDAAISPYFYPADDDYVTAVGGTHLTTNGPGGSWASEIAWNSPYVGSGGGISPDGIAIPAWQSGVATFLNGGSTTLRNVPDVAMEADLDNYSCDLGSCGPGWGGTSFAAPRWAGFIALVNQQAVEAGTAPSGGIGFFNPSLYTIGKGANYSEDLHDITAGNNDTDGQPLYYFAVPGYDLVTGWGSANGQSLIDDLAGKQVPGFWIEASSTTISLLPGQSSTTAVTVTDAAGFSGNVTLAITSTLPKGVTSSWSKNPTSGTSVLTIHSSATASTGTSTLTISGSSGKLTAVASLTLQIQGPTFALSSAPSSLLLNPGSSVTSTITLSAENEFTGNVNLAASGLPAGVTASFSPLSTSGTSTLTLKASASAVQGPTGFTITGTSGDLVVSAQIPLLVAAPTIGFYGLHNLSIGQSSSTSISLDAFGENGLTGNIQLSISGLPTGVTALFSPSVVTPQDELTTLTLVSSSSTPFGTNTLTITGTSGSIEAYTKLTLNVDPPSFAISGPMQAALGQGTTSTFPIYVYQEFGFTGYVQLAVSGLPQGVTASISPNPANGQAELTLSAASTAVASESKVTITGTSGKVTASTSFALGIFTPTFVVSTPGTVAMGQVSGISVPISVTQEYGFSGSINFAVSGLPTGVTAYISPNPATGDTSLSLISSTSAPLGTTELTVTGICGKQISKSTLSLSINPPSFTVSSPGAIALGQGTTISSAIPVSVGYGFAGIVNLSVSGLPSGVSASITPNPTTGNAVLTLTTASSAPLGTSTVTITGTSGKLTSTATFPLSIAIAGFTVQTPGNLAIGPGTSTNLYVPVTSQNGFTGPISLSISGLPTGVSASFSPNPAYPAGTAPQYVYLNLSSSNTVALGTTVLTITGTSGKVTSSTTLSLTISPPTFSISSPPNVSMGQGTTNSSTLVVFGQYGFSGNVALSVSGLPSGVTASFSPNPATLSSGFSVVNTTLTLTASGSAAAGLSSVKVTAISGKISSTTTFPLTIYAPSFTVSGPASVSVGLGTTTTTTVNVNQNYGFTIPVNLSVSGLPTGVSASISPNPSTAASQLTLTAGDSAVLGTSVVTITGTSGKITSSATFPLTIGSPTFTLSGPGTVNIDQGSSVAANVFINPLYGFTGYANLSVSGLPSGLTASFSPNPSNGGTQLTLTASNASTIGTHILTVTASYGKLTQTVSFPLVTYAQSFTLSNQGSVIVGTGSSATTSIGVNPQYGFTGSVNLTASNLPSGVTASFSPNPTSGSATLTLTASNSAPLGYSVVVVTGIYGNQRASTAFLVGTVAPSFTVSIPEQISLGQGSSTTAYVYINPQNGFSGSVTLSASNLPVGVSASFSPDVVTGRSQMTITASSTAAVGATTLIVTGTSTGASGKLTATTPVAITVYQPSFQLESSGATTIGQGSSSQIYVNINPAYGFAGEVNLAISGLPSGVTASILPNPITSNSTITLTASSTAALGNSTVTLTGTSGKQTQTTTIPLTVAAPSFNLSNYCGSVVVVTGTSSTCYLNVNPLNGFEGSVTLAITGLPGGVTASFSPNPTASQAVLTLTASSTAPLTTTNPVITGTSGTQTSTLPLALTVAAPTFALYLNGNPSISPGGSNSTYVYVNSVNGFSGNVNLSISGLPSGVSAAFSANPVAAGGNAILTLSATAAVPTGTSTLTITGSSGNQKVTATLALTITASASSFSIAVSGLSVGVGTSSTNNYVYVQGNASFSANVKLAIFGLPAGVTASFSPNPTSYGSNLILQATNSAIPGEYNVTITGTSGALTASTAATLTVGVPSFTINTQAEIDIGRGTSTTAYYLFIEPENGFHGNVQLAVTGLPSGVTASFSPNPANPSSNQTVLTLTASTTATLGQYTATITGTSGKQIVSDPVTVGVYAPTFTLESQSGSISPGSSTAIPIYFQSQYGFSSAVTFAVSGLPSGVTGSFSPNPAAQNVFSSLTLQASPSAPLGQYNFTVTGTSGSQKMSATFSLSVNTPALTLEVEGPQAIGQGSSSSGYVNIEPYQFTGNVHLSISGLPAGVTASFSPNPTVNGSSTFTLMASSSAALGQFNVTVTGTYGNQTASAILPLTVYVPTFTLSGPDNVVLGQGTTTTATAYINSEYGFAGNVKFAVSGLPTGVTVSLAPNPTTQQTTLTFTASSTATLGQYNALITGTSGSQSSSTYFPISIYAPTFTLSGPYYGVTISQGTVGTTQVTINPGYGFTGKVSFGPSGLPAGLTASFSPNPTAQTTNLTLTAAKTLPIGTYNLTVNGISGSQRASVTIPVTVNTGTFSIDVPQGATLGVGGTAAVYAGYTPTNGFQGSVSFAATGLPKGVTASIAPDSTPQYSYIVLTAGSNAVLGNYTFTITGTSGSLSSSTSVPLAIVAPTFALLDLDQYYGDPIDIAQGTEAQTKIVIDSQYGFTGNVSFTVSSLLNGVTASFSPNPGTQNTTLTLTASNTAPLGIQDVTVTGTSGGLSKSTTFPITIFR